jgi:hypothetical protein
MNALQKDALATLRAHTESITQLRCNSLNAYRAKMFSSSAIAKSETLSTAATLFP